MRSSKAIIALLLVSVLLLCSCNANTEQSAPISDIPSGTIPEDISSADLTGMDFEFTEKDKQESYNENEAQSPEGDKVSITKEGTYILSGSYTSLSVNAPDDAKIHIVFDNVEISNPDGPAVFIAEADKVFITLKEGSTNSISDGESYTFSEDNSADGAIFSRADLTINGSGSLAVKGNNKHGIVSKDDLVIVSSAISAEAKNVAINGKDCVKISGANLTLKAGSDGIRSDNEDDKLRGYIYMESGNLNITAGNDGFQAETAVRIDSGDIKITAGGGSGASLSSTESFKGIKAQSDIIIYNGSFDISSKDDCIHSNNTICISDGKFNLSSGDDGIHADTDLAIANGEIAITKSYEGIESSRIFISGGNIDITASDDGLNAAGGNDSSAVTGGRPGMGQFSNGIGEILISGGYTLVNANGDGIDSNGTIALTGGIVLVSGPTNGGNGAFDYDGSATVKGGVLIALGSSDMAQNFSSAENQGSVLQSFTTQSANTSFALCDSDGKLIVSFTPEKSYQSAVITAPEIQKDKSYTIICGGTAEGADENGFAHNSTLSGGTKLADITMTALIQGSGGGPGGKPGGKPDGQRPAPPDGAMPPNRPSR